MKYSHTRYLKYFNKYLYILSSVCLVIINFADTFGYTVEPLVIDSLSQPFTLQANVWSGKIYELTKTSLLQGYNRSNQEKNACLGYFYYKYEIF